MPVACGAKVKSRAGGTCKAPAMPNGRCRMHGGPSTGPKNPNTKTNALKHGFYSDALLPEEQILFDAAAVGDLEAEIRLGKVKLHRMVKLSGNAELETLIDGAIEATQKTEFKLRDGEIRAFDKTEIKALAPNYADLIVRQLEIVRKLELSRVQMIALTKKGDTEDPLNPTPAGFEVVPYEDEDGT